MPAVGLDISDQGISVLELIHRKDTFAVGRFGRRPLPPDTISGGYVKDKDRVAKELGRLKEELRIDFVNASVSEEKAYLFKTRIPRVSRKEIRSVLDFKLEENVPIPRAEAIFDYTVITQEGHDAPDHLDVSVTVLPRKVVDTYSELLKSAGLVPLAFEVEAQAISRSLVTKGDRQTYLIVSFGEMRTGLFIVSDEVVHFTSTVSIGGQNITEAIAKHLSVSLEEAQVIKKERVALKDHKNKDLFLSLMNTISVLRDEVNKLSTYWNTHKDLGGEVGRPIRKILLCGKDASIPGFVDYLSLTLNLPVEVGNVWTNAFSFRDYIPPIPQSDSLDYAAAVGLALPKIH